MKKSLLLLLLLSLITVSCSGNQAEEDVVDDTAGIEMEDASDAEFEEEEPADINEEVAAASDEESQSLEEEEVADVAEEEVAESSDQEEVQINESAGQVATYTVEKNETLMWIAFKIYGDYSKWKDIRAMNTDKIRGQTVIAGTQINYTVPDEEFQYNPKGNPYLIKQEDTLGTISTDVYGTGKHWKYIWDNNKVMIKNPNLIFAGFTLYYVPLRDIANN